MTPAEAKATTVTNSAAAQPLLRLAQSQRRRGAAAGRVETGSRRSQRFRSSAKAWAVG